MTYGTPAHAVPFLYRRLLELGAISTDDASTLATRLAVATLPDLYLAIDDGRIARGLPAAVVERIVAVADVIARDLRPVTLGRAADFLDAIQDLLRQSHPDLLDLTPAGGVRRYEPLVDSLVLVGRASEPGTVVDAICDAPWVEHVALRTPRRALVIVQQHEVDIRVTAPDEFGTVLFMTTGAREHVRALPAARGIRGLVPREEDVYAQAGLAWVPPELRHGTGEIEAARRHALPNLVQRQHIRGDLHMHTTYSDGQDTLESMVATSVGLGYQYIAITDHSESAGASRTVSREMLPRQRDEVERMRERYPGIDILHGIEVDILPNGRLDFDDEILAGLDIVLASLHDAARHDPATLTRRCLAAIRHPLVNVITHPANQLVGRRTGYELDYPAIYAAAAETGTALEVDGAPSHLDLDGEHARAAVAAGVTLTIDSDCHRAKALARQMDLGVGTARRGWVEPQQVLNCRPVQAVRAFVAAKRERA